jgi:hypothetical protein
MNEWFDHEANMIACKLFNACQDRWQEIEVAHESTHNPITTAEAIELANHAYEEFKRELDNAGVFPTLAGYKFRKGYSSGKRSA